MVTSPSIGFNFKSTSKDSPEPLFGAKDEKTKHKNAEKLSKDSVHFCGMRLILVIQKMTVPVFILSHFLLVII